MPGDPRVRDRCKVSQGDISILLRKAPDNLTVRAQMPSVEKRCKGITNVAANRLSYFLRTNGRASAQLQATAVLYFSWA
jgi:hypothetical protein